MRFSASGFLHGSVSPKPLIIPLGLFQMFSKIRGDIRSWKCTTGINNNSGTSGKIVDTGGKFAAGDVDTGGKFATSVIDTGGAPWLANIFREKFSNKFKMILVLFSGAWWKMIHEKIWSKKSRDTVPLSGEFWTCDPAVRLEVNHVRANSTFPRLSPEAAKDDKTELEDDLDFWIKV
jgi:hypothetical protein